MTAWQLLRSLHEICCFQTREGPRVGKASASELKRWIQNRALLVNGLAVAWDDELDDEIRSVVLFPKKPVTLL